METVHYVDAYSTRMATRLIYIDDSGATATRYVVYGWVELDITDWQPALRAWLDWRHALHARVGIPTDYELHATKFANGRGRPTGTAWDGRKSERSHVMTEALQTIATLPGVATGSVFSQYTRSRDHRLTQSQTYARLVQWLDARLTSSGDLGVIVIDGDGTDPTYRSAHRQLKLATRSVIEDPFFHGGHQSQWVQMADITAYTAYMRLAGIADKKQMAGWYEEYLAASAVTGSEPLELGDPAG